MKQLPMKVLAGDMNPWQNPQEKGFMGIFSPYPQLIPHKIRRILVVNQIREKYGR